MMELLSDPNVWVAFLTLTALEIVLGIDNIIFISILTGRLPEHQQQKGRMVGLGLAMAMRICLLFAISWIVGLTNELFSVFGKGFSGRDLILLIGGAFLLAKATMEVHESLEGDEHEETNTAKASFLAVITQIAVIDMVFSLDSVITAVGIADHIEVMIAAVVISVAVMMIAAKPISEFVEAHPSIKMLALSFLMMIGLTLVAEAFHVEIPKGYIYFAMAFSIVVELLNIRVRKVRQQKHTDKNSEGYSPLLIRRKVAAKTRKESIK